MRANHVVRSSGARAAVCITGRQLVHPQWALCVSDSSRSERSIRLINLPDIAESFFSLKLIGHAIKAQSGMCCRVSYSNP